MHVRTCGRWSPCGRSGSKAGPATGRVSISLAGQGGRHRRRSARRCRRRCPAPPAPGRRGCCPRHRRPLQCNGVLSGRLAGPTGHRPDRAAQGWIRRPEPPAWSGSRRPACPGTGTSPGTGRWCCVVPSVSAAAAASGVKDLVHQRDRRTGDRPQLDGHHVVDRPGGRSGSRPGHRRSARSAFGLLGSAAPPGSAAACRPAPGRCSSGSRARRPFGMPVSRIACRSAARLGVGRQLREHPRVQHRQQPLPAPAWCTYLANRLSW